MLLMNIMLKYKIIVDTINSTETIHDFQSFNLFSLLRVIITCPFHPWTFFKYLRFQKLNLI